MVGIIRVGTVCVLVLVLSVLALPSRAAAPASSAEAKRALTHGFVIAPVYRSSQSEFYDRISVERLGAKPQKESLWAEREYAPNPGVYADWLPAGEYRFIALSTMRFNGSGISYEGSFDLAGLLPNFTVKAGEVLDLGLLHQQFLGTDDKGYSRSAIAQWPGEDGYLSADAFARSFPKVAAVISPERIVRWNGRENWQFRDASSGGASQQGLIVALIEGAAAKATRVAPSERFRAVKTIDEFFSLVKDLAETRGTPAVTPDGTVYVPSSFGQIRIRKPGGTWSRMDTGALADVRAVHVDGTTVRASRADGTLLETSDQGATWQTARAPCSAPIASILRDGDGRWLLGCEGTAETDAAIHRGAEFLRPDAEPWRSFVATPRERKRYPARHLSMVWFKGRVVASVVPRTLASWSPSDGNWQDTVAAADVSALRLDAAGESVHTWASTIFTSADGANWTRLRVPGAASGTGFVDPYQGYAIETESKGFGSQIFVNATRDGGKTWSRVKSPPGLNCFVFTLIGPSREGVCEAGFAIVGGPLGADGEWRVERNLQ